ncbi:MAG: NAD(P)H-hydrate dehydratase [Dethiobacteria bacterium]|jgi:hydroxyethylthiazole kinase-like uncharacterized protein yjeF
MKLVSGKKMGAIDREAIEQLGIPGLMLMENAGLQVVKFIQSNWKSPGKGKIIIICGKGNNGGDGFVISRHLHRLGYHLETWAMGDISDYKGDAAVNYHVLLQLGFTVFQASKDNLLGRLSDLGETDLIVDALLGTGIENLVRGPLKKIIAAINDSAAEVVAIDIPSGISADSGAVMGTAVKANYTVTFALPKRGLLLFPGVKYAGRVLVVDIGIPKKLTGCSEIKENLITGYFVQARLPRRQLDSHKGSNGRVLILAGSPGMTGAATMAGEAALRGGAGLVYVGTAEEISYIVEGKLKEVITLGFPGDGKGNMTVDGVKQIAKQAGNCQALAFGPGLKPDAETLKLYSELAKEINVPMVVDAGGLGALALSPEILLKNNRSLILTPHPGEMSRLTGIDIANVQQKRWELAAAKAAEWNAVVVLKGTNTVIALPNGDVYINPTGNPVLATAGTGDLLTGLIASLLAQGLQPEMAAICGVYIHGLAADLLSSESGKAGFIAGDVLQMFPRAINEVITGFSDGPADFFWIRPYH